MANSEIDVLVAGSGPAGSTAATLLAQQGHSVLMIDRDKHPRFHIGESLLPMSEPILQRLGIKWREGEYLPKNGSEFMDEQKGKSSLFPLADTYQPYQVERAKFDNMMFENAIKHGVKVKQSETIRDIEINDSTVKINSNKDEYLARYFIDASGRSAIMGRKLRSIERIRKFGQYSLYAHYKNARSTLAKRMYADGYLKIVMVDIGWIWVIPLTGSRLSVGLVVSESAKPRNKGEKLFTQYINASKFLTRLLSDAIQEDSVHAEADFSFYNKKRYGCRFACCGDASGFLDPVFSSGVFMAVTSAQRVADRVSLALKQNKENDPLLHADDDKQYMLGFNSMLLFVERFYNHDLVGRLVFESQRNTAIKEDIIGLLAGDLWSGDNEFQHKLLTSRQNRSID